MLYFHDNEKGIVYAVPCEPQVEENTTRNQFSGWTVWVEIEITRSDNLIVQNQWKYKLREVYKQDFETKDSKEEAIRFFIQNNYPLCEEISKENYSLLKKQYEEIARCNR